MTPAEGKRASALAAIQYVKPNSLLGVGTGSTVNVFIDALAEQGIPLKACVSSSEATTERLQQHGYEVISLNESGHLALYVDGADEFDPQGALIKGGGGALTREKIIADASDSFVCIVDGSKRVPHLGAFPLPVEVIPMARSAVARALVQLGGQPVWRDGFVTDNGNLILDVHGLSITKPNELEATINQITGVVTVGLFARRGADVVLMDGTPVELSKA